MFNAYHRMKISFPWLNLDSTPGSNVCRLDTCTMLTLTRVLGISSMSSGPRVVMLYWPRLIFNSDGNAAVRFSLDRDK